MYVETTLIEWNKNSEYRITLKSQTSEKSACMLSYADLLRRHSIEINWSKLQLIHPRGRPVSLDILDLNSRLTTDKNWAYLFYHLFPSLWDAVKNESIYRLSASVNTTTLFLALIFFFCVGIQSDCNLSWIQCCSFIIRVSSVSI